MSIKDIKMEVFNIIKSALPTNCSIVDNPYNQSELTFPFVMIQLADISRERTKILYRDSIRFKIDIFSDYSGEEEIIKLEEEIYNKMSTFYSQNSKVSYMHQNSFRIIDDNSTGVLRKHGIINYTLLFEGGLDQE